MPDMGGNLLQMKAVSKSFGGINALCDVSLDLGAGEVLGLVGENGAGKSTLIKILGGALRPDSGCILLDCKEATIRNPQEAHKRGIRVVYQELSTVPTLSVAQNLFLESPPVSSLGVVRQRKMLDAAKEILSSLDWTLDVTRRVGDLSVAEQQLVEIAKAIAGNARILVLDEPTASLSGQEWVRLRSLILSLARRGLGVVFVSHRLDEILDLSDRVMALRDGHVAGVRDRLGLSTADLVRMMIGRDVGPRLRPASDSGGEPVLSVRGLSGRRFSDVSFELRRGEILGIAGLVGSGRTDLVRAIFGADRVGSGEVLVEGIRLPAGRPDIAIKSGVGLIPEDRKGQGLVLNLSVSENVLLPNLDLASRWGYIIWSRAAAIVARFVKVLGIATTVPRRQRASELSGGNQQKLVVAKWLASNSRVLILDEPTRGIDVGTKAEIHRLMRNFAEQGNSVIMVSSELPEVIACSDRVMVMHEGRLKGILPHDEATESRIMELALGNRVDAQPHGSSPRS